MTGLFSQEIQIIDFVSVNDKLELCLEKLTLNIILKFQDKKVVDETSSIFLSHKMLQETHFE